MGKRLVAKHRTKIPDDMRTRLIAEAGGKCANPGCPVRLVQIHHIHEWAVYETHDENFMVAVCAACHDAIHRGEIPLSDEVLLSWKSITRPPDVARGNFWVEPSESYPELWFGSFSFQSDVSRPVIGLSAHNRVELAVAGSEVLILDLVLTSADGVELIRMSHNTIKHQRRDGIYFHSMQGQAALTADEDAARLPKWVKNRIKVSIGGPDWPRNGKVQLFRAEVVRPGVARIGGLWVERDRAIVADRGLCFFSRTHPYPIIHRARFEGTTRLSAVLPPTEDPRTVLSGERSIPFFGFADEQALFRLSGIDPRKGPLPLDPEED